MPNRNATKRAGKGAKTGKAPAFDARATLTSSQAGRSGVQCQPKQIVFRQGDHADAVYYIDKGKVRLTVVSKQGKERVIAMLEDGDFFGEGCLAGQPHHMASAVATTASNVLRIDKAAMVKLLHEGRARARENYEARMLACAADVVTVDIEPAKG